MAETVIELKGLTKVYRKFTAADSFDLTAERGHIRGLIGPNGAGKTTLMRMIAGITKPTSGEMLFFGSAEDLDKSRRKMSFMIESPIIDPTMTAYENMNYVRIVRGIKDNKIKEVLDFVGLGDTGRKKAGKFSLGMRQRLGIGMSLLTEPEVMVLDEPVNGLDPEGIVYVRKIIKQLAEEKNVTVIISSHLLSELSELCTDFTLMNHGKLIESISAEELHAKCTNRISLKTTDIAATRTVLEEKLGIKSYKLVGDDELHITEHLDDIVNISKTIFENGIVITRLAEEGANLEQYYLSKVGGER